jgi:hypothetical protein
MGQAAAGGLAQEAALHDGGVGAADEEAHDGVPPLPELPVNEGRTVQIEMDGRE